MGLVVVPVMEGLWNGLEGYVVPTWSSNTDSSNWSEVGVYICYGGFFSNASIVRTNGIAYPSCHLGREL